MSDGGGGGGGQGGRGQPTGANPHSPPPSPFPRSHHFSTESTDDVYLKKATRGTDIVSFVFGLDVSWDLTQKQNQLDLDRKMGE